MRMMLKMSIPVEAGNAALKEGRMPMILGKLMEQLKPEAAYFYAENGKRTAIMVFDMKDTSHIPVIAEPGFMGLNADISLTPVMNGDDLKAGLEMLAKSM